MTQIIQGRIDKVDSAAYICGYRTELDRVERSMVNYYNEKYSERVEDALYNLRGSISDLETKLMEMETLPQSDFKELISLTRIIQEQIKEVDIAADICGYYTGYCTELDKEEE